MATNNGFESNNNDERSIELDGAKNGNQPSSNEKPNTFNLDTDVFEERIPIPERVNALNN